MLPLARRLLAGLRALLHHDRVEWELDDELAAYLDAAVERLVAVLSGFFGVLALCSIRVHVQVRVGADAAALWTSESARLSARAIEPRTTN